MCGFMHFDINVMLDKNVSQNMIQWQWLHITKANFIEILVKFLTVVIMHSGMSVESIRKTNSGYIYSGRYIPIAVSLNGDSTELARVQTTSLISLSVLVKFATLLAIRV